MSDPMLTPLAPLDITHRLEYILETLEAIEASLVRLSGRVAWLEERLRDDHAGLGRRGLTRTVTASAP